MFLVLFSVILFGANMYTFANKKYLYLFIPCMLFLPEYYGIEISSSLPLFTVTRLMYVVFFIYAFINRRRDFSINKLLSSGNSLLISYFIIRIIANCYYIFIYNQPIKTILSLIFEQALLLIAFYMLALTNKEQILLIKSIVMASTIMFVLGIFESLSFIRVFSCLNTVSRTMLNDYYVRLGLLRATASMGLANYYGNMCILISPFIFYLLRITKEKKYIAVLFLNILAIIHSGCRSDILFFAFIVAVQLLLYFKDNEALLLFVRNVSIALVILLAWILVLSTINGKYKYYYEASGKAALNLIGFNFDLNEGALDNSMIFGDNIEGMYSRSFQFSAIEYTLGVNPFFGLGSGCENRGDLQYLYNGTWRQGWGYDLGIVEIVCSEGLVGLLGYILLLVWYIISLIKLILKRKTPTEKLHLLCMLGIAYMLCLFSTANLYSFLILIVIFLLIEKYPCEGSV